MALLAAKRDWGRIPKRPDQYGRYRCSKCREWKAPSEFNKNKKQLSGLNYCCKICNREDNRKYNLPAKYGISAARYAEMLLEQGNKCACCGIQFNTDDKKSNRPCVDHNHATNEVRNILCGRCNLAAGNVGDSSARAKQLAEYLEKWGC